MPAAEPPLTRRPRRRLRLALLALGVTLAHAWLIDDVALSLPRADAPPQRLEVAFVRELAPTAPPPPPPAAAPPRPRPKPAAEVRPRPAAEPASAPPREDVPAEAQAAASAPLDAASAPPDDPLAAATAVADAASAPASAPVAAEGGAAEAQAAASAPAPSGVAASAAAMPAQAAASAAALASGTAVAEARADGAQPDWPPATQLDFELSGWYRGEVHGSARVQWLRQDRRYQVHLDVTIGPSFAPLMSRRMSSDGEITARGLAPRRYDEVTKFGFSSRRTSVLFEPDAIVLGNGTRRVPELGVQDAASQFVQMTWMFTLQPGLLKPGGTVALPLALPKRMDNWTYDVLGEEVLDTPLGRIPAVHLRPRMVSRGGSDVMTVEAWFAPTLQYLPVRLLIRQSAEVWADLKLRSLPLQAR